MSAPDFTYEEYVRFVPLEPRWRRRLNRLSGGRFFRPRWHHFAITRQDGKILRYLDGRRLP